jgi:hypothetical protein
MLGEEDPGQGRGPGQAGGAKNAWGTLTGVWVPHDTRDQIVAFVRRWSSNRSRRENCHKNIPRHFRQALCLEASIRPNPATLVTPAVQRPILI